MNIEKTTQIKWKTGCRTHRDRMQPNWTVGFILCINVGTDIENRHRKTRNRMLDARKTGCNRTGDLDSFIFAP